MKFKHLFTLFLAGGIISPALADISVEIPDTCGLKTLYYYYAPIKQFAEAKTRAERGMVADSVSFTNSKAVINLPDNNEGYLVGLNINNNTVTVYGSPKEALKIDVTSCNPFTYSLSGSEILNGMNQLLIMQAPLMDKYMELKSNPNATEQEYEEFSKAYTAIQKNFINSNPGNAAVPVAMMDLDGEDFINIFDNIGNNYNSSILYPLLILQYDAEKKNIEMEKKQQSLQSGEVMAPNFTLKDLDGKDVSLSDFRGKWVILDFWGSWCPWCIKGFPELKEAYKKYAGKLEIIGIDCRESEADWRAGVEKYQLPWVNVYNAEGSNITSEYGVQGYPTKAIINPEGKISNITVGHDPKFFDILQSLIGE